MYTRSILFSLGALLFGLFIYFSYEGWVFKKLSVVTEGVVLNNIQSYDSEDDEYNYTPVVGFVTTQGEAIKFESAITYDYIKYDLGEYINVRYNITDPFDVIFDTTLSLWWKCIVTFVLSVLSIYFGFKNPSASDFKKTELDAIDSVIRRSNR